MLAKLYNSRFFTHKTIFSNGFSTFIGEALASLPSQNRAKNTSASLTFKFVTNSDHFTELINPLRFSISVIVFQKRIRYWINRIVLFIVPTGPVQITQTENKALINNTHQPTPRHFQFYKWRATKHSNPSAFFSVSLRKFLLSVEVKIVTWAKDSHGLFDYESKHVSINKLKVESTSKAYKEGILCIIAEWFRLLAIGTEILFKNNKEIEEIALKEKNAKETPSLFNIIAENEKNGKESLNAAGLNFF